MPLNSFRGNCPMNQLNQLMVTGTTRHPNRHKLAYSLFLYSTYSNPMEGIFQQVSRYKTKSNFNVMIPDVWVQWQIIG